jgi:hypothetical protein
MSRPLGIYFVMAGGSKNENEIGEGFARPV